MASCSSVGSDGKFALVVLFGVVVTGRFVNMAAACVFRTGRWAMGDGARKGVAVAGYASLVYCWMEQGQALPATWKSVRPDCSIAGEDEGSWFS